jgi:DNA-binding MarR family transcriptional regulator
MQPPDEGSMTEYQTLAEFRYQLRRFLRFSEQTARTAGLEPQQHQLLLAVKGLPQGRKATIGTLAERLQLAHHSTVELIDRLVERGFVQRCRDEADGRRVLVNLTPQGEEVLRKLSLTHQAELRSVGSELVQTLNTLLKDMNH